MTSLRVVPNLIKGGVSATDGRLAAEMELLTLRLEMRLHATERGASGPLAPFQGLVISDEEALGLLRDLARRWRTNGQQESEWPSEQRAHLLERERALLHDHTGEASPFSRLVRTLELTSFEQRCLAAALAPELDLRFERLFAYCQDDVSRRAPSLGFLLDLFCDDPEDREDARRHLSSQGQLRRHRILTLIDRPVGEQGGSLGRGLRLEERVVEFLLGLPGGASRVVPFLRPGPAGADTAGIATPQWHQIAAELSAEPGVQLGLIGLPGAPVVELASWLSHQRRQSLLVLDGVAGSVAEAEEMVSLAAREAVLNGATLALVRADQLERAPLVEAFRAIVRPRLALSFLLAEGHGVLHADRVHRLPRQEVAQRAELWQSLLTDPWELPHEEVHTLARQFPLSPATIHEAVRLTLSEIDGEEPALHRLRRVCLRLLGPLPTGVTELMPERTWEDLVLPADAEAALHELAGHARHRSTVLSEWGFGRKHSGGKGTHALFVGPPGTGKTMGAEVLATTLHRRLWRVDLPQVISKYIGETEKNLDAVFRAAANADVVLFFDEADALFGRRSEVKDAHDRYANQEISFLLQRMEDHEGLTILATNLGRNIDEAFVRRLAFLIEFPFPDEVQREQIWTRVFPDEALRADDICTQTLAREISLSGGHIRNIALAAAYLAVQEKGVITQERLWRAAHREYQKLGQNWQPSARCRKGGTR